MAAEPPNCTDYGETRRMIRLKTNLAILLTMSAAASLCGGVAAQGDTLAGKSDAFLARAVSANSTRGWSHVIVRFAATLNRTQERKLAALHAGIYRNLPFIRSAALRVPTRNLAALAALPFVERLSADVEMKKTDEFTVEHTGADTAFRLNSLTGTGVGVAIVDSGVHMKADLKDPTGKSRIVAQVSFRPGGLTDDACGHGTHIAGIIAGSGKSSTGTACFRTFYGIARNANIVNVRVLDKYGQATVSTVLSGIQWTIANKALYNIRVMNLSMGHPVGESYTTDPLCQAVEAAWKSGITVVCAAGNGGRRSDIAGDGDNEGFGTSYGSIQSPGNDPFVITVGASKNVDNVRANDRIATYSGRGPSRLDYVMKPDIVAPGNRIIALCADNSILDTYNGNTNDIRYTEYMTTTNTDWSKTYFRLSGTSMAAPVVAGAVALLLQKDPMLTPDTIKARLMITADKRTDASGVYDPCTYGAGHLNITAALQSTAIATQSALSPALIRDSTGSVLVDTSQIIWGTAGGSQIIWGINGVNDLRVIWGSQVIWGTSLNQLSASQIIWGTSVWADQIIWGTSNSAVDLTSTAIQGE
jgi:serine protease AprX